MIAQTSPASDKLNTRARFSVLERAIRGHVLALADSQGLAILLFRIPYEINSPAPYPLQWTGDGPGRITRRPRHGRHRFAQSPPY